ncbi:MAG: Colicin production protein [Tardiphaga sp.]|uniref:CvpA family protein n=1 Tax=Tardiphaga sp. TaxID=1926292 RepID=UPI00262F44C7|nr:CvpA family protein [Tardiphaga sp.]MDB5500750.1 Colicin production protein [Tardiphaga sp.]
MNTFDLVVYVGLAVAVVIGFRAGLLRSVVTILGYFLAMPIAVWVTSLIVPQVANAGVATQNSLVFFGAFLVSGIVLGSVLRMAVDDMIGPDIGIADRLAGAALGAARVGLIAVTLVLIFDQMLPANLQPSYMTDSKLRPLLSQAGQRGFKSLPPDVTAYIDKWKRDRRI